MSAIVLDNVTVSYRRHPAVHHVSGCFAFGSLTAVTGPNGAGKSTLLKAIAGLLPVDEGTITAASPLAYLPQISDMQRDFPIPLLTMVATGFWREAGSARRITSTMQDQASSALAAVGLRGFEKRGLASLSAGQFQRALFARLLVQDNPVALLDEPFNAVDESTTRHLLALIQDMHQQGRTIICVLHHLDQIRAHFPQCLLLARECIGWGASYEVLQPENLLRARMRHNGWKAQVELCQLGALA